MGSPKQTNGFEQQKKNIFLRRDKSKKRSIDEQISELVKFINSLNDFYTTSSCSGRIMLIERKSYKKNEAEQLFSSHETVSLDELMKCLKHISKNPVWFKQENLILHVCARDIESAKKLLNIARQSGFKRSGIISAGRRTMIEIESGDNINALISREGELLVTKAYLSALLEESNQKMKVNSQRIEKFFSMARKAL